MANETMAAAYGFIPGAEFLNEFSLISFENILFDIISYIHFVHEQLFDQNKKEIAEMIASDKAHRPSWYVMMAKRFQYGFPLVPDEDYYDNSGYSEDQIADSKIIKYAAITPNAGRLYIKIATETAGELSPISEEQKISFDQYIFDIADAGVKYLIVNYLPDLLLLNMQIFIDPLVLTADGMSKLNGNFPVQEALEEFMKELPFNGELVLQSLGNKLQQVEGVKIVNIVLAESQSIDVNTEEYNLPQPINVKTVPVSGYFKIPNFDQVSYVV